MGEYCLVVEGASADAAGEQDIAAEASWWKTLTVAEHVERYEADGLNRKEAMKKAAGDRGVSRRDIYQELLEE